MKMDRDTGRQNEEKGWRVIGSTERRDEWTLTEKQKILNRALKVVVWKEESEWGSEYVTIF